MNNKLSFEERMKLSMQVLLMRDGIIMSYESYGTVSGDLDSYKELGFDVSYDMMELGWEKKLSLNNARCGECGASMKATDVREQYVDSGQSYFLDGDRDLEKWIIGRVVCTSNPNHEKYNAFITASLGDVVSDINKIWEVLGF